MYRLRSFQGFGAGNLEGDGLCRQCIAPRRFGRSLRIGKEGAELVVLLVFQCWCTLSNQ